VLVAATRLSSSSPLATAAAETVSRTRAISTSLTWWRSGSSASDNSTGTIKATASQIPCRSQGFITTSCHRAWMGRHGPSVRCPVR
jgi:hypothetical protein